MKRIKNALIDFVDVFGIVCLISFLFTGNLLLPMFGTISFVLGKMLYEED